MVTFLFKRKKICRRREQIVQEEEVKKRTKVWRHSGEKSLHAKSVAYGGI
jgi:hypothetical protein